MRWSRFVFRGVRQRHPSRLMRKAGLARDQGDAMHSPPEAAESAAAASEAHIREGDRLRDTRQYAAAAEAYQAALAFAPERTDIRVQHGNMLKDCGMLAEAEAVYREALAQMPDDPDLHLQLGHALKMQEKRPEALASYRRAAEGQPASLAAIRELFEAGCQQSQQDLFERQVVRGSGEALMAITEEIARLQGALTRLAEALPNLHAQTAFPIASYDRFRRIYDVPSAPAAVDACRFAIILSTRGAALATLYAQIASVSAQSYREWQLRVVGGDAAHRRIVERAAASDPRIAWIDGPPDEEPAAGERRAAGVVAADWLVFLAEGGLLHRRAIEWFAAVVGRGAAKAYVSDEERVSREDGVLRRTAPVLRQVVDYDTLLEANPFGETVVIEREAYAALAADLVTSSIAAARSSLLVNLACTGHVGHIPLPLCAREANSGSDVPAADAHRLAVCAHLERAGLGERIAVGAPRAEGAELSIRWVARNPNETILVIIPTRDNGGDVREFADSLRRHAAAPALLRILVVDNGSRDAATLRILEDIAGQPWARVVSVDEPFNWSRLNNRAVELSNAPLLVFANDDMQMLTDDWDLQLRGLLDRPAIGAVGARLIYSDNSVQHAGILFDWQGQAIHDGRYEPLAEPGPCRRWQVSRAVSAVTGAFMAIRRETFVSAGGFDEIAFPVAYSDFDLALKLRARGLKILWTPHITLRHVESKTRGLDHLDPEKRARNAAERQAMADRWGAAMQTEPSLSPVWHRATLPFRLLSAPSQARLWRHIRLCASANPWLPDHIVKHHLVCECRCRDRR